MAQSVHHSTAWHSIGLLLHLLCCTWHMSVTSLTLYRKACICRVAVKHSQHLLSLQCRALLHGCHAYSNAIVVLITHVLNKLCFAPWYQPRPLLPDGASVLHTMHFTHTDTFPSLAALVRNRMQHSALLGLNCSPQHFKLPCFTPATM